MKTTRAIAAGCITWLQIFSLFTALSFIPSIKDSQATQAIIACTFMVFFSSVGAYFYFRNGAHGRGLLVGLIMTATALALDALITVPVAEIPNHGSYASFFTNPLLWVLVLENIATVYLYWTFKVKRSKVTQYNSSILK